MIPDDNERGTAAGATLDELFLRAAARHPHALALIDPANRQSITGGVPRLMTFVQADRAITALAARLHLLGLPSGAVVALQLPNIVESVIALLAVLRAGMIAAPLPLLWRKQEIVAALGGIGAQALMTCARVDATAHAEIARQVAVELLSIRQVCGFGHDLPDGVVPLDDCIDGPAANIAPPPEPPPEAAAAIAVTTFEITSGGLIAVARNHTELIAGGLAALLEAGIEEDTTVLSTIPLGSFAGIALTMVPWLITGGPLVLQHGFDAEAFSEQCRDHDVATVVLPAAAVMPLAKARLLGDPLRQVLALWRAPEQLASCRRWLGAALLADVASFGEVGLLAARRGPDGLPLPIPCGVVGAPRGAARTIAVAETARSKSGTLTLRGPMVPANAFPPGVERSDGPHWNPDAAGFVDTRFACRYDRASETLTITAPPAGITAIGGYRFRQNDVDWLVAKADLRATIVALPDAMLGQRLAGGAPDPEVTEARLQAQGVSPLIGRAFHLRRRTQAA